MTGDPRSTKPARSRKCLLDHATEWHESNRQQRRRLQKDTLFHWRAFLRAMLDVAPDGLVMPELYNAIWDTQMTDITGAYLPPFPLAGVVPLGSREATEAWDEELARELYADCTVDEHATDEVQDAQYAFARRRRLIDPIYRAAWEWRWKVDWKWPGEPDPLPTLETVPLASVPEPYRRYLACDRERLAARQARRAMEREQARERERLAGREAEAHVPVMPTGRPPMPAEPPRPGFRWVLDWRASETEWPTWYWEQRPEAPPERPTHTVDYEGNPDAPSPRESMRPYLERFGRLEMLELYSDVRPSYTGHNPDDPYPQPGEGPTPPPEGVEDVDDAAWAAMFPHIVDRDREWPVDPEPEPTNEEKLAGRPHPGLAVAPPDCLRAHGPALTALMARARGLVEAEPRLRDCWRMRLGNRFYQRDRVGVPLLGQVQRFLVLKEGAVTPEDAGVWLRFDLDGHFDRFCLEVDAPAGTGVAPTRYVYAPDGSERSEPLALPPPLPPMGDNRGGVVDDDWGRVRIPLL